MYLKHKNFQKQIYVCVFYIFFVNTLIYHPSWGPAYPVDRRNLWSENCYDNP